MYGSFNLFNDTMEPGTAVYNVYSACVRACVRACARACVRACVLFIRQKVADPYNCL